MSIPDPELLPVFVSNAPFGHRRPASPSEALEAIISHCLLLDPDCDGMVRIAIKLFVGQALSFEVSQTDLQRSIYPAETSEKHEMRARGALISSFRAIIEAEAERVRKEDLQIHDAAQREQAPVYRELYGNSDVEAA